MTLMDAPVVTPARLSREDVKKAHEDLRKALVAGSGSAPLEYAASLAAFAANARRTHGTFRQWSMNNCLLLEAQRRRRGLRHVGLYAGVRQWAKMEREVRKDAVPLTIWIYAGTDEDPQNAPPAAQGPAAAPQAPAGTGSAANAQAANATPAQTATAARRVFRGFIPRDVYDYSDTVSLDPDFVEPNWAEPLAAGDRSTLDRLVASSPVPVRIVDFGARVENGKINEHGISVHSEMPVGNRISTLAHELAHHHLGHLELIESAPRSKREEVRASCEAEAGLAQWLVMKMLGLDESVGNEVTTAAADYLRSWIDPESGEEVAGHKRRERLLAQRLGRGLGAAETIVDAYLASDTA